ncbi:AAA family ATPase [Nocardioides pocheonensis]|nr:adenylate/guanylate cyclase domain-containing protein [Nocardioides pocheonensis]
MNASRALAPYVPRLVVEWLGTDPEAHHRRIAGSLAFVDISGFTALTERLARKGHVGAEEMSDALDATFSHLLGVADRFDADLVKWGGDAVLLLFSGEGHAARACAAAYGMRARLREVGQLRTSAGNIRLRMSVGIHSGEFDFFLVGDPHLHRELLVTGPAASETARLEGVAQAGQVVVSATTAAQIGDAALGDRVDPQGWLLRRAPAVAEEPARDRPEVDPGVDVSQVLSVAIREHLLAGPGTPEHRTIAVGFVQFAGTDALLAEEGPEATATALDDCMRNVSQAAAAHGVTFFETDINADGGKIMLTAGAPRTAGHDADRLLRTARQILDHAGRLPLRIGVNTGHVFSGDFGPPFRRTYSVKGDAINLAARIMGKASPGELLATRPAYEHSETRFETTDVGPFTLKGKARPVAAVSVGAVLGGRERRTGQENVLVGREEEMALLRRALEDARSSGRGGVVQLLGEPGIGKSRLMQELAGSADDTRVQRIVCDEYQSATPYAAFSMLLRDLLGLTDDSSPEAAALVLTALVEEVAPQLTEWAPLLGDVLDVDVPETTATAELDDEFRKARLESTVLGLLRALLTGPTLVTVDDAQHMDPASADLLSGLAAEAGRQPWLLVVSRRDQPLGWIPRDDLDSLELRVSPLGADDAMRLALSAAGGQTLPRPTLAALAQKAGGNPLFLESLVSQTGPTGALEALPESIEEVVAAQIDQLSPMQRSVLRHAAVLGSQFAAGELAALLPDLATSLDEQLRDGLADFLVPAERGSELRFRHGLIREVAYQGLAYQARRRMHDQVGLAMERTHAATRPELLSFHFLHAGRYDRAFRYARTAGDQARRMYANTEATELFSRAVEASRRLPRDAVVHREVGQVLEALGDCWFVIGHTDAAADAYRQAHRYLRDDVFESARIVTKLATVDQRLRKFPQAMRRLRRELRTFDGRRGAGSHRARSALQRRYAISKINQGRVEDAIAWGTAAVEEAKRSGDPATLAPAYTTLHGIYLASGRDSYRTLGTLALQAYVEIDDLAGQAQCTNNLAVEALEDNRWVEAATMFRSAADLYRRLGDTDNEGVALCNHAEVLVDQGRYDEAGPLLDDALATARSVSDDELVALVLRQQGRARSRASDPEAGLVLLDEARALFEKIDAPDEAAHTGLAIAEAMLLGGQVAAAVDCADELLAAGSVEHLEADLRALRGLALLRLGHVEDAIEEFGRGVEAGRSADRTHAYALSCLGLARAGVEDAAQWHDRGATALRQLGVVALPLLDAEGDLATR